MGLGLKSLNMSFINPASWLGGDDAGAGSGDAAAADEARKDALRRRIDSLYGIAPAGEDPGTADAAAKQMATERSGVEDATRSYYSDALARSFGAAERNNRFRLARQGLQGGSEDVDSNTQLETDRTLGATRIDQAARSAAAALDQQREQERLNAISLVNSGAGDSAVTSAQLGLKNSLNQVANTNKANLFGDLFSTGADAVSNANVLNYQQQLGALFNQKLPLFTSGGSTGGRITPN